MFLFLKYLYAYLYIYVYIEEQITKQKLAFAKSLNPRLGNDSVLRYLGESELLQDIVKHLRIGPVPSVQRRLMLKDRQTGSGIGFSKSSKGKR